MGWHNRDGSRAGSGVEAQPRSPKGGFCLNQVYTRGFFLPLLHVVPQIFGSWDVCRGSHLFLSCFQAQREAVPCAAWWLLGVIPSSMKVLPLVLERELPQGFGDSKLSCVRSSVSSEQATSHQESTRHRALHCPSSLRIPWWLPHPRTGRSPISHVPELRSWSNPS